MIHTVSGEIDNKDLGLTLMHEHIVCDGAGADYIDKSKYDVESIVEIMVPYLNLLKASGCQTLVDSTPPGEGQDLRILEACSKQSGLKIITNIGSFYGKGVTRKIKESTIEDIVNMWTKEYREGIKGTAIRPGFIKVALDDGRISALQEKILRAACRTSLKTNLTIQCHAILAETILQATTILREENLPFSKFIWAHADSEGDVDTMIKLGREGMWIELDGIGDRPYGKHIKLLKELIHEGILDRLLLSQDTGWYNIGQEQGGKIRPYHKILTEFIPLCYKEGITQKEIYRIMVDNPAKCLDIYGAK